MKTKRLAVLLSLLISPFTLAQTGTKLCQQSLDQDRQPNFSASSFQSNSAIQVTGDSPPKLRLDTNLTVLDPEKIYFPFTQRVTIDYVFEAGGASWTLGWFYYDDLVTRGYINTNGTPDTSDDALVDSNANGIDDFHEDLYNMAPTSGTTARPFIGNTRRCSDQFTTADGQKYTVPSLGQKACGGALPYTASVNLGDSRPGRMGSFLLNSATIGTPSSGAAASTDFSDNGLFPHMPNLLEPKDPSNNNQGIGHLVFLLADDDTDTTWYNSLPPVADGSGVVDGVPDYDVSAYDANGRPVAAGTNPNVGISTYDRRVDLGLVDGQREMVFFILVYYDASHPTAVPNTATQLYPCLKYGAGGVCSLYLRSPISAFFSKTFLNLDQNFKTANPSAEVDIGCPYSAGALPCIDFGLDGWLDAAALARLATPAYNTLVMPHQKVSVPRPANNLMPHALVGAPATDPFVWILGFEDLNGGGDRDFNDVVFKINKLNGAEARSGVVSSDISPAIAEDFTITRVRFTRDDDVTRGSWYEDRPGACAALPAPSIDYYVAVDCKLCSGGNCVNNPTPTWIGPLSGWTNPTDPTLPGAPAVYKTTELDLLSLGFTGSQLCWRTAISSPNEFCRPTINDIKVGYNALRAGDFARASVTPIANGIIYGTYETPGRNLTPAPTVRMYDGKKDFSFRGHLYFKTMYDPEVPDTMNVVVRWDGGKKLSDYLAANSPLTRKIYSADASGARMDLSADLADSNTASLAFPDTFCGPFYSSGGPSGRPKYDLNGDTYCQLPTTVPPNADGAHNERRAFKEWLYGWEDQYDVTPAGPTGAGVKRPWVMGAVNQSTVAVVGPPGYPDWFSNSDGTEQTYYKKNFYTPLAARDTYSYVGTMGGALHGFFTGKFRAGDDNCTADTQWRGYFERSTLSPCPAAGVVPARNYGTGNEGFAYFPRKLLSGYVNHYQQYTTADFTPGPKVDASPAYAAVDLGGMPEAWAVDALARPDRGAKTVLASATGPGSPYLFALDVTDPTSSYWPRPMWEFDLGDTAAGSVTALFSSARVLDPSVQYPDTRGTRFSPPVGRVEFGTPENPKWIAAFSSDFAPNVNQAGTVYFMDLATGRPLRLDSRDGAGVVTLEDNVGVSGPPAMVDADSNGKYDTFYVPTVNGKIWRINTGLTRGTKLGRVLSACVVANVQADLQPGYGNAEAAKQRIYSALSVKVLGKGSQKTVRFFAGTADSPDLANDVVANNYHLVAYEDATPLGACNATFLWERRLPAGHRIWGGLTLAGEGADAAVLATTAVGAASDACSLSETEDGDLWAVRQDDGTNLASPQDLGGGQGIAAPVVYDNHLYVMTPSGVVKRLGGEAGNGKDANNRRPGGAGQAGSRMLLWDSAPGGQMPK